MTISHFSQPQLADLLLNLPVGITIQNTEGELIYCNERAVRLLGFTSIQEMQNTTDVNPLDLFSIYTVDDEPYSIDDLPSRQVMRGARIAEDIVKYRVKRTDETLWSHVKAIGMYDDQQNLQFVVNMMEDITEVKESESRLRDANDRITKILQGVLAHDEKAAV